MATLRLSVVTDLGGLEPLRPPNEGDAFVMEADQVLDGLSNPAGIVQLNVAEFASGHASVERDDRNTGALDLFDETGFHFRGHDRDPFNLAVKESRNAKLGAFRAVLGVRNDDFVVPFDGDGFEGFHEVGEEGVGNVGDDEPEDMTLTGTQRTCVRALGMVVKIANGSPNFSGGCEAPPRRNY